MLPQAINRLCGISFSHKLRKLLLALASRLAFLALDYFIAVRNAVTVVGFGNSYFTYICSRLSNRSLIYARNDYFVYGRTFELDACGFGKFHGVGKAYVEYDFIALFLNFL